MATYYFRNTGDVNWGTASNWSLTDGGGATGAVPTSADDAYFTSNSGNCTVNASSRVCKTLIFSGVGAGNYANTITMTNQITVSGNITLSSGMTISGTGNLLTNATCTFTSNTKTFPNTLIPSANITFADAFTITNDLDLRGNITVTLSASGTARDLLNNFGGGAFTITLNGVGFILSLTRNLTVGARAISGTAKVKMICSSGTGTWSSSGQYINTDLEIDATASITISGTVYWGGTGTLKYTNVGGTFTTTGSTLVINGNNTLDLANSSWATLSVTGGTTTISNTNGTATFSAINNTNAITAINLNTGTLNISGGATFNGSRSVDGSGTLNFNGTGTITGSSGWTTNVTVNTSGTITFGTLTWGTTSRTWTHTAGTTAPGTGTFTVNTNSTFSVASSGFIVYNMDFTGTITINTGTITMNNNLTLSGSTTFAGTGGWTAANFTDTTAGRSLTLKDGSTYTVTSVLSLTGTNASRWTITSSSATLRAIFTLSQGASQSMVYVNGTRVDSSGGQTVWSLGGTLTDTINWNNGARPAPFNTLRMA